MDRLTEIPEIFCGTCCNFSKENMDMGGSAQCKAIGVQTFRENYAGDCRVYNIPKEQILVFPCKVRDMVYRAETSPPTPFSVRDIGIYLHGAFGGDWVSLRNFGKTIFLNRGAAVKALWERKNDKINA